MSFCGQRPDDMIESLLKSDRENGPIDKFILAAHGRTDEMSLGLKWNTVRRIRIEPSPSPTSADGF